MVFKIALYAALTVLIAGLIHRVDRWFLLNVGAGARDIPIYRRFAAGLREALGVLFSLKIFSLIKVLLVDVLLQARILRDRKDPVAWLMHLCIFFGFVVLLIFHALGTIFYRFIAPDYIPTLNPFMFLRNLFGLLLFAGIVLAAVRRILRRGQIETSARDVFAIAVLGAITVSGFWLEGLKITSYAKFVSMAGDYGAGLAAEDIQALRLHWVKHYGLISPVSDGKLEPVMAARGLKVHQDSCAPCHVEPQAAFISYPVSRVMKPVAVRLDQAGFVKGLYYFHILSCFFGLAYLAFSKMFHIISTPVSLAIAEVAGKDQEPAAAATRQVIEMEGCSHGGACHEECPVRKRRLERIEESVPFEPMLAYVGQKSPADLGSRRVSD